MNDLFVQVDRRPLFRVERVVNGFVVDHLVAASRDPHTLAAWDALGDDYRIVPCDEGSEQ